MFGYMTELEKVEIKSTQVIEAQGFEPILKKSHINIIKFSMFV